MEVKNIGNVLINILCLFEIKCLPIVVQYETDVFSVLNIIFHCFKCQNILNKYIRTNN